MNVLFSREATNNSKTKRSGFSLVLVPRGKRCDRDRTHFPPLVLGVIPKVVEHMNFPPFHFPTENHTNREHGEAFVLNAQTTNQKKTETTINNKSTNLRWLPETINKTNKNSEQINKPRNKTKQDRVLA